MQTTWMMTTSAAALGFLGLAATFLPREIAARAGADGTGLAVLLLQLVGGLYVGFAMLNWSIRDMTVGGIYNRPIVIGNLLHFTVFGLTLVRVVAGGDRRPALVALAVFYGLFAAWFGRALFHSPTLDRQG